MSRHWVMGLCAAVIAAAGCASEPVAQDGPRRVESRSSATAGTTTTEWRATEDTTRPPAAAPAAPVASSHRDYALVEGLKASGPDADYYTQVVMTLSDPFFEGRSADTRGGELARDYLAHHMRLIGLEPAFPAGEPTPGGAEASAMMAFDQGFSVNGPMEVTRARASYAGDADAVAFTHGEDFEPMGFTANKSATAPLAFVGYSIEQGQDGYATFAEGDDLNGRIAVMLRYEPTDAGGASKWARRGWTDAASLVNKMNAAAKRGAAGVILVNPPILNIDDINALQPPSRSRFRVDADIPVIQLTPAAANAMVKLADPEGRNLADLQKLANESGGVVMFNDSVRATLDVAVERKQLPAANVGGVLPGKGRLADEWVIIGAHYDHVGYGHLSGARPSNVGQLHPGADDNASGTAGVLVLAKRFKKMYDDMGSGADARSVLFLCFAAEEMGLLGAAHFVENNDMDPEKVQAMLNMDMIGRLTDDEFEINGTGTAQEWDDLLRPMISGSSMEITKTERTGGRSDHAEFAEWGTPALHFFTGTHGDYHQPSDVAATVNYEGSMRVIEFVEDVAVKLATMPDRLTYVGERASASAEESSGPRRGGFSVRLGIRPEAYEDGTPGVLVGEVYPETSAADGGMLKHDRIIRWDGHDIADVQGMMQRLASHKPGDTARIVVVRGGQEVELSVPMKAPAGAN